MPTNYSATYEGNNVINTYAPPTPGGNTETTLVAGTKVWKDYNNALNTRPNTLTVSLYQNNILLTSEVIREVTGWHYRFDNLPKYDTSGKEYVYTVKENQVPEGYKAEISKDGTTITNTLNKEANELVSLNIQKKWIGDSKSKGRPKSITVKVYRNDSNTPIKTIKLSNVNKWTARIKNLPKFDDNGKPFKYAVSEVKVDGYRGTQITRQVPTTDVYNVIITNAKVKPGDPDDPSDPSGPGNPGDPNNPDKPNKPKTEDDSPLMLFSGLLTLAAIALGATATAYKRKKNL